MICWASESLCPATTIVPDTKVTISREPAFPPLPNNSGTDKLAARAQRIYAEIGKTITTGGNGGASQSALAADGGIRDNTVPVLRAAGAETVVMGSLAFGAPDLGQRLAWIRGL